MTAVNRKEKGIYIACIAIISILAGRLMLLLATPLAEFFSHPETVSLLVYLETGRVVKPAMVTIPTEPMETTVPKTPTQPQEKGLSFDEEDAQLVQVSNFSQYAIDVPALLMQELQWNLEGQVPRVLILHSHATESYTKTPQDSYVSSAAYRTLDTQYNMVRVGAALKEALEAKGISVIHDTNLYDYPSYNDSYIQSREALQAWLKEYPEICLVIDLHRDAADTSSGSQLKTLATVSGENSAQLMMVVGSNAGGRHHPQWKQNLALAAKLHAQLEKRFPGICRPISFRTERFNQDLSAGALLIEVGAAGDMLEEALVAAAALAEGIADLSAGVVTADSTS